MKKGKVSKSIAKAMLLGATTAALTGCFSVRDNVPVEVYGPAPDYDDDEVVTEDVDSTDDDDDNSKVNVTENGDDFDPSTEIPVTVYGPALDE